MKKATVTALVLSFLTGALLLAAAIPAAGKTTFVSIGTGDINGLYYPTGGAMAKVINTMPNDGGIRVVVESTEGSVENINAVLEGKVPLGIVQSDRAFQAVKGQAEWADQPRDDLRSVFGLFPEAVTLVVSEASEIRNLKDVKGKRIFIGRPGSGQHRNALDALSLVRLDSPEHWPPESFQAGSGAELFLKGGLDGFFTTVGHPSEMVRKITEGPVKVRFVAIKVTDPFLDKHSYYTRTLIRVQDYPGLAIQEDTPTFGAQAILVASAKTPDEVVYAVTKAIFQNLDEFRKSHPVLAQLTEEQMVTGLIAPLHPGALKFYQESGLDKYLKP